MNFQIEITSYCNLRCVECPNYLMQRPRKFMTRTIWDIIIDKYVNHFKEINKSSPPTVIVHKDGEPLLHKYLPDFLQTIPADCKIDIYTNGLKLTRKFIEFLWQLPHKIRLLITCHYVNYDGTLNDYSKTTYLLEDILSPRSPQKNIEYILVSHLIAGTNQVDLEAWKRSWRNYNVTVHTNAAINPWTGLIKDPNVVKFDGCPYDNFGHMFFGVTGNVLACCMDLEEQIVFGNVETANPQDMFIKLNDFYAKQRAGKMQYELCRNCFGK